MKAMLISTWENMRLAIDTLLAHRFRSFLTLLGIFIGVLLVVTVASVLNGFRQSVVDQVEQFGTNNIYIRRFPFVNIGNISREMRQRRPLRLQDAEAIRDYCPSVELVSAGIMVPLFLAKARYRGEEMDSPNLRGVFPENAVIGNRVLEEGRFFTDQEEQHAVAVCAIGHAVVKALFPTGGAIGKDITIDGHRFTVIGTFEKRKEGPFGSENEEDKSILAPYHAVLRFYPTIEDHFISVRAASGKLKEAAEEIAQILRQRRKVRWSDDNNFEMGTADSIIGSFDDIVFATLAVMFLLSTVGFMVGGVGVMNIMLVSVKERTREIGLRKAVGARRIDIMGQFLIEAMTLCTIGGIMGLLAGELLMRLVSAVVEGLPTATPMWARVFAFAGSASVGLFFGMWPAWKAARLDPIEALRHE